MSLVLLAAARPSVSDGRGVQAVVHRAPEVRRAAASPAVSPTQTCRPGSRPAGYVNPLAYATVTPKRIDQGVDYAGSGTLGAIGGGTITQVALSGTGWPGAFIEYQLRGGPEAWCYVYYAEGVTPAPGLHVGEAVTAGQAIAVIDPGNAAGIEIGWAAHDGTRSYAAKMRQWSVEAENDNIPTAAGLSFSALVSALGGPGGKIERHN
jgi:hypothetical protein